MGEEFGAIDASSFCLGSLQATLPALRCQKAHSGKAIARPANTKLTPDVALELYQRAGSKAYLAESIGSLGSLSGLQSWERSTSVRALRPVSPEKDTIVLADFANSAGDAVFDDTLKTALSVSLRASRSATTDRRGGIRGSSPA